MECGSSPGGPRGLSSGVSFRCRGIHVRIKVQGREWDFTFLYFGVRTTVHHTFRELTLISFICPRHPQHVLESQTALFKIPEYLLLYKVLINCSWISNINCKLKLLFELFNDLSKN